MNWEKEFLERIDERRAPMALVPWEVLNRVAEQLREGHRNKKRFKKACCASPLFLCILISLCLYIDNWSFMFLILPWAIVLHFLWESRMDADNCCLERGYLKTVKGSMQGTMKDFAVQFDVLCEALGPINRGMGNWMLEQVVEYMKRKLREQTSKVKALQDASPDNPCAGAEEMLEFKRLYWLFTEWSQTDFGGFGQYFPDK